MSDDNVIPFNGLTKLELPVDTILDGAKGELDGVVLMGWNKAGELHFASSYADSTEILWLIEVSKKVLMNPEANP